MTEVVREPGRVSTRVTPSVQLTYPSLVSLDARTMFPAGTQRYRVSSSVAPLAIFCAPWEMRGRGHSFLAVTYRLSPQHSASSQVISSEVTSSQVTSSQET